MYRPPKKHVGSVTACVCVCVHFSYREALCDGDLDVEEKDLGSESSADSNRLLGITEHAAHTGGEQLALVITPLSGHDPPPHMI